MAIYETSPLLKALALAFIANKGHEDDFREFIRLAFLLNKTRLGEEMLIEFNRFISELRACQKMNLFEQTSNGNA